MTPTVFADTGYWIAMFNPNDELHDTNSNAMDAPQEQP